MFKKINKKTPLELGIVNKPRDDPLDGVGGVGVSCAMQVTAGYRKHYWSAIGRSDSCHLHIAHEILVRRRQLNSGTARNLDVTCDKCNAVYRI